jgi:uncharacterized membrane protein YfcA
VRLVLIGLAAGFFSALLGVGGGLVIVPLLILAAAYEERAAAATSLAAIGMTALAGAVTYAALGRVHLAEAAAVGLPAAVGALVGTTLQQRLRRRGFSLLFAAFLVLIALDLLLT